MIEAPLLNYSPDIAHDVGMGPLRVLVADENRNAVVTLMTVLRQKGYEVRGVYKGNDVLQAANAFTPDAVLLDVNMPGTSGDDVTRALRKRYGKKEIMLVEIEHHLSTPLDVQAIMDVLSSSALS